MELRDFAEVRAQEIVRGAKPAHLKAIVDRIMELDPESEADINLILMNMVQSHNRIKANPTVHEGINVMSQGCRAVEGGFALARDPILMEAAAKIMLNRLIDTFAFTGLTREIVKNDPNAAERRRAAIALFRALTKEMK